MNKPPHDTDSPPHDATHKRTRGRSPRRRWLRRLAIAAAAVFVVYTLVGFFLVPVVVQRMVLPRVAERLQGDLAVEDVLCNPFTLGIDLRGITITEASGREAVRVERVSGNFDLVESVIYDGWWFDHLRMFEPDLLAEVDERGRINLLLLLADGLEEEESEQPPPRLVIADVAIDAATIRLRDRTTTPHFERTIADLDLRFDRLDTRPTHANRRTLTASIGDKGARVEWRGETRLDPFDESGVLSVEGFRLAPLSPYAQTFAGLQIADGVVDLELRYALELLIEQGTVAVRDSRVTARDVAIAAGDRPVLNLAELEIAGIAASLTNGEASVDRVAVTGLEAAALRHADGRIDVVRRYLEASRNAPFVNPESTAGSGDAAPQRTAAGPPRHPVEQLVLAVYRAFADMELDWRLTLGELEVSESAVRWTDRGVTEPVDVTLSDIAIEIGRLTNEAGTTTPVRMRFNGPQGGGFEAQGELAAVDRTGRFDVKLAGWPLGPLRGYLPADFPEPFADAELVSAIADAEGSIEGSRDARGFDLAWDGRIALGELATRLPKGDPPLSAGSLALTGGVDVAGRLPELTLDARWRGEVDIADFQARLAQSDAVGRLTFESLRIDGGVEGRFADGAFTASWEGGTKLEDLLAKTTAPIDASLTAGRTALSGARATWRNGEAGFEAASLAVEQPLLRVVLPMLTGEPAVIAEVETPAESGADRYEVTVQPGSPTDREAAEANEAAKAAETAEPPDESAADEPRIVLPFALRLDELTLTGGGFEVTDQPGDAGLTLNGRDAQARVEAIDTADSQPMRITASTSLLDAGRAEIAGEAAPFHDTLSADLTAKVRDLPLRPLSPALAPQLGFAVDRGRLNVDLPIRVTGTALEGRIDARLQGFYLGEKVDSPAAPSLPIKLALDLLRNRDDVISLDIGLAGDVSDPTFTFGKLVWGSIFKSFASIISSPFKLIASAVGGSDGLDLSHVAFVPGTADLAEGAAGTVEALADGLQKRPRLNLLVVGLTGPADEEALTERSLDRRIARLAEAEGVEPRRALRQLFEKRFPEAPRQRVPVPPGRLDQRTFEPAAMRVRLLQTIDVEPEALADLARSRSERVVNLLTDRGVDADRLSTTISAAAEAGIERTPAPAAVFELLSRSAADGS